MATLTEVPVVLDPTVILVSAGVTNPIRQISRVVHTVGNTWEGISSTGITAAYSDEVTETSDNAPTLAQPTANLEKAQAFVPFSIEIGEDWAGFQSEMGMMFQDAKDTLENTQFLTGLGHTSHVPQGLIAVGGATAQVTTATTAVIAAADLYSLEAGLAERWLRRAQIVGSRAFFQKVRQLDIYGGASLWVQLRTGTRRRCSATRRTSGRRTRRRRRRRVRLSRRSGTSTSS
jgi:HK97 family phage major capsid protein